MTQTATVTKEHPILMSTPMVKALLFGQKTQTRRIINPDFFLCLDPEEDTEKLIAANPYGQIGDRLWVKETYMLVGRHAGYERLNPNDPDQGIRYRATWDKSYSEGRWRPSIFCWRWASRITLEITGIRVERVQSITEEDAIAEGTQLPIAFMPKGQLQQAAWSERQVYQRLWDHINGKKHGATWKDNPWVFVVDFKVVNQ